MGETKKEQFIFTLLMCFGMASLMTIYNIYLHIGIEGIFFNYLKQIPLVFVVALILDVFVAGPLAKGLVFKFISHKAHMAVKILAIGFTMVTCMVFLMSIFGTIMQYGFNWNAFSANYWHAVKINWIAAFPINLLFVGPLARLIFEKIFPKPVLDDNELV